jgi:hypothetical protein
MADIRKVKLPNGSTYNIKDNTARSNINNIINGTTKLPYGKSLSITNNSLNLLDPNNNILSTVSLFKKAHFEYSNSISIVIDEVSALAVGDLVYITQLPASDVVNANSLFYVSDIYYGNAFYMNSGENKADFNNVYSISTRYDYIAKVINVRNYTYYDFEIIAGGPTDNLMYVREAVYQDRTNLIPALGQTVLLFESNNYIIQYLTLYDANNNQVTPSKEILGILANGKALLQYTCNKAVTKIHVNKYNSYNYMPNFVFGLSYAADISNQGRSNILYTNKNGTAEGIFIDSNLQTVYDSGASSWDLIFICDYAL